jgi:hypothetical protein
MTGKILGRMLQRAGIYDFLYFYGEMSQKQKAKSISDFKENPNQKILVSFSSSKAIIRLVSLLKLTSLDNGTQMWLLGLEFDLREQDRHCRPLVE